MANMEITKSEFAKRLDINDKTMSKLIKCEIALSNDIAKKCPRCWVLRLISGRITKKHQRKIR